MLNLGNFGDLFILKITTFQDFLKSQQQLFIYKNTVIKHQKYSNGTFWKFHQSQSPSSPSSTCLTIIYFKNDQFHWNLFNNFIFTGTFGNFFHISLPLSPPLLLHFPLLHRNLLRFIGPVDLPPLSPPQTQGFEYFYI